MLYEFPFSMTVGMSPYVEIRNHTGIHYRTLRLRLLRLLLLLLLLRLLLLRLLLLRLLLLRLLLLRLLLRLLLFLRFRRVCLEAPIMDN